MHHDWDPFKEVCPAPERAHGPGLGLFITGVIAVLGVLLATLRLAVA